LKKCLVRRNFAVAVEIILAIFFLSWASPSLSLPA
jgi:hypothetical protein